MENTIDEIETIADGGKYRVTPAQKRQLLIRMQEIGTARDAYASETEFFTAIGKLQAMSMGAIPFEGLAEFKVLPIKEKSDEKLMAADFFADAKDSRAAKLCLMKNLQLIHEPQSQTKPQRGRHNYMKDHPNFRRFKVWNITRTAAMLLFERNRDLFAVVDVYFYGEREDQGSIAADVTLPKTPTQIAPAHLDETEIDALLGEI